MAIHLAITRRVRAGLEADFQKELNEFFQSSFNHGGVLGASMLVPPPGSNSREFGILRSFADEKQRDAFYASPEFKKWDQRAREMTEGEPVYRQLHGLEAWFRSDKTPPPRWKMAIATVIGVYPTSLFLTLILTKTIPSVPLALRSLIMASAMVALLTWAVMPIVIRVLHSWLQAPGNMQGVSSADKLSRNGIEEGIGESERSDLAR